MFVQWNEVGRLNLIQERKKCQFDVKREKFYSEESCYVAKNQLLSIKLPGKDEFEIIGEVPSQRPLISYVDVFNWVNDQLSGINIENKLVQSKIEGKCHALFQQYLFNINIKTPDNQNISPALFLRASYYGPRPALEIHFGAFRYICSNGMIESYKGVKESFFSINHQNWKGLTKTNLRTWLESSLEKADAASRVFEKLNTVSLKEKQKEIFSGNILPIILRKRVLGSLELDGNIEVLVDNDKKREPRLKSKLLKAKHLENDLIDQHIHLIKDISLWDVYNNFTSITTEHSMTSAKFITDSQRINEMFNKVTA
jgi:hypothetical protein